MPLKSITIRISEPTYREFQEFAKCTGSTAAELIREAMKLFCHQRIRRRKLHSLLDHTPISLGKPLKPSRSRADLLEHFFDRD
jgi:hypothetical protein